jgi:hypothetical protein
MRLSCSALLAAACAGSLPAPPLARHPHASFEEVPYPPPAALAETIPKRPDRGDVVWIDGGWTFRGRTFSWQRGGWVVPPAGASYAPSSIVYGTDGRVLFAPGTWYGKDSTPLERVRPVAPAVTPPNEYTSETQTGR